MRERTWHTMDEKMKFQKKLKELLEFAKQKKNVLESQEIVEFFQDIELDSNKLEKIYDFLEKQGIDILRFQKEKEADEILIEPDDTDLEGISSSSLNISTSKPLVAFAFMLSCFLI